MSKPIIGGVEMRISRKPIGCLDGMFCGSTENPSESHRRKHGSDVGLSLIRGGEVGATSGQSGDDLSIVTWGPVCEVYSRLLSSPPFPLPLQLTPKCPRKPNQKNGELNSPSLPLI